MTDEIEDLENEAISGEPVAEDPADVADQSVLTVDADVEVPPPALVKQGWAANAFSSFKYRDFTLFWSGALVSNVGTWMQNAALAIVVWSFDPARASLNTGIVQGLTGIPVLFLAIPAGLLADRVDRRKLLVNIQIVLLLQALALGVLYDTKVLGPAAPLRSLVLVSGLGLLGGIFVALQAPAFQAVLPDLVPRPSLMNAIALNTAQVQSSRMLGPAIVSGLILVGVGIGTVFYINAASFVFVILALLAIRTHTAFRAAPARDAEAKRDGEGKPQGSGAWEMLTAGISYAVKNRAVGILILTAGLLVLLGFPYVIILTAIIQARIPGADVKSTYSIVYAFNGAGALIGSLAVAGLPATIPRHRVIPVALAVFSLLVVAFSFASTVPVMCAITLLAGAAYISSNSLIMTSVQAAVPGHLRGRVMALYTMAFMGVMPLSAFLFGPLGQAIGPDNAVLGGGIILLFWALLLLARPGWVRPES